MKHLAIVPLIGGMTIGAESVLGTPPEAVLSYDGFYGNEKFLMQWYEKRGLNIPYHVIDDADSSIPTFKEIDVVTSLCPCSGLTSANPHSGAGCQQNQWMLKSTNYVLKNVRPKTLIGENASRLYTNFGQPVVLTMKEIAEAHGYHLTLLKTDTKTHGLPQRRCRSFFILYRKDLFEPGMVPLIKAGPAHHTPWDGNWVDFLDQWTEPDGELYADRSNSKLMNFLDEKAAGWGDSALKYLIDNSLAEEFLAQHPDPDEKNQEIRLIKRAIAKRAENKGVWDSTPKRISTPYFPSVMYRSMTEVVHPRRRGSLKPREFMRLMGLPETMDVPSSYMNAIAQNVPACTAEWAVRSALSAVNGDNGFVSEEELIGDGVLRQSNLNGEVRYGMPFGKKVEEYGGAVHKELLEV